MKQTQKMPVKRDKNAHRFSLYIAGASPNSSRAVANIKYILEKHIPLRHELDIIDIHQYPDVAKEANIIALPFLIRTFPLPLKRLIGDMSDHDKIIRTLNLQLPPHENGR